MASPGSIVIQAVIDSSKAVRDAALLATGLGKVDTEADTLDGALKDAQAAMDRTGSEARDTATDLGHTGDQFDRLGADAQAMADDLRRSSNEMAASIRGAGDDIEHEAGGIRQSMGEAGSEAGAEFIGNIAEGIGSGQANLQDVVTGTLGGLTNLAATLSGPVGLAAGAAAAGIGLVFAATKKQAEEAKERLEGIIGALQDVGDASSAAAKQAIWDQWLDTLKESPEQLQKISGALQTMNIDTRDWQDALTGNEQAAQRIHDQMTKIITDVDYQKVTGGEVTDEMDRQRDAAWDVRQELEKQNTALGQTKDYQSDLKWLTQGTAEKAQDWATNTGKARTEAQRTKDILDALDGKDVRVDFVANYTGKESDWNPAARAGGRASATPSARSVTNVTINMQGAFNDPIGNAKHIKALLEQGDLRQGRPRGAPLAVAWG